MPKFVKATDASARTLDIYNKVGGKSKQNQYVKRAREINNFENKKISGSVFNNLKNSVYSSTRNLKGLFPETVDGIILEQKLNQQVRCQNIINKRIN